MALNSPFPHSQEKDMFTNTVSMPLDQRSLERLLAMRPMATGAHCTPQPSDPKPDPSKPAPPPPPPDDDEEESY